MSTGRLKVALAGCGAVSGMHLEALSARDDVDIVALCDPDYNAARRRADAFAENARIYSDLKELYTVEHPDVVHISTPHDDHVISAITALDNGAYVLLEKPPAATEEQLALLADADRRHPAHLCICFQNRTNPTTVAALSLIAEHGGAVSARAMVTWHRQGAYYTASPWRGKKIHEGGSVLINQAIHALDLLLLICGEPQSLYASVLNFTHRDEIDTEDTAVLNISCEGGVNGHFYATTSFGTDAPNFIDAVCRDKHTVTIWGERLYVDGQEQQIADTAPDRTGKRVWGSGHARLISLFYSAIREKTPMPVPLTEGSRAFRTLLTAYRSNGNSTPILPYPKGNKLCR